MIFNKCLNIPLQSYQKEKFTAFRITSIIKQTSENHEYFRTCKDYANLSKTDYRRKQKFKVLKLINKNDSSMKYFDSFKLVVVDQ